MATPTAILKTQFDLHTRLFNNATEGITDEESNTRKDDNINHIKWVAGHMLHSRLNTITKVTGGQPDETYAAQFARGTAMDADTSYPPLSEITARWNEAAATIGERLNHIPENVLEAKSPVQAPVADDTMRGLFAFLMSHEAYHVGQLGILRKMAGKEPMSFK